MPERKIYEAKITAKGQMVIPKPLREKYNLERGQKAKIIATKDGLLLKPSSEGPWVGLRGMMKADLSGVDIDRLILEAKRSLFGVGRRG